MPKYANASGTVALTTPVCTMRVEFASMRYVGGDPSLSIVSLEDPSICVIWNQATAVARD